MKILIIEDEQKTTERLLAFIARYNEQWRILEPCETIQKALLLIQENPEIDLILADIELRDGNLIQAIGEFPIRIPIIFITAYNQYLQEAFQANSIYYICKPFVYADIEKALEKFQRLKKVKTQRDLNQIHQLFAKLDNPPAYKRRFLVQKGKQYVILETEKIHLFEAEQGVIFAHTGLQKFLLKEKSLQALEACLNPRLFFRINRHQILRGNSIKGIERYNKNTLALKLENGSHVRTSQGRTPAFKKWIEG